MTLRCLIVDDEPLAHNVIKSYIGKLDNLTLAGQCYDAIDAINVIHTESIDILFLDINMPELSGLDMLKTLKDPPTVVLTTAYSEYALEGYEFGVSDYLLKPIRFDRFLKCINRIVDTQNAAQAYKGSDIVVANKPVETSFFVKSDGIQHKVHYANLSRIESKGNYVLLHADTRLMVAETLTSMTQRLEAHGYLRVHKSHTISISHVKGIEGNMLIMDDCKVPIGNSYRQIVLSKIGVGD